MGARLNGIEKVEGSNPSGSTMRATGDAGRSYAIMAKIYRAGLGPARVQVRTGVVGHPVSELGNGQSPGGSPAQRPSGAHRRKTELACFLEREASPVNFSSW